MTLARLVVLAEQHARAPLEPLLLRAEALHAERLLDRRAMEELSPADDAGSIVNLLAHLRQTGDWNDARTIARYSGDLKEALATHTSVMPVLTVPPGARLQMPLAATRGFVSIAEALKRVIGAARYQLKFVSAFAYASAAEVLGAALADATARGVRVRFVTQAAREGYDPLPVRRALDDAVRARGDPRHFEFKAVNFGTERMMHAKIVVADTHTAFVGSANFTGAALADNIEAGFVVTGPPADAYSRLIDALEQG